MNRNKLIDIAKGMGILFVVFGHNPLILCHNLKLYKIIFSFHMPLFFFLSGIFFIPKKSFKSTFIEKADSLLKPYFVTLLLVGIVYAVLKDEDFVSSLLKMLYGNGSTIRLQWVPLWFLPHLFTVIIFSWILINVFADSLKTKISRISLLSMLLIFGVMFIRKYWDVEINFRGETQLFHGLPFSVDIILITSFYYLLGYYSSKYVLNFKPIPYIFASTILLFFFCHYFFDQTMDLNIRVFNGLIVPAVESLSAIYIILVLSYYSQLSIVISKIFSTLGISSLFILIFHKFFQEKAYDLANYYMGGECIFSKLFAFFIGGFMPVLIWHLVKKNDYLSFLYLPIKSKFLKRDQINQQAAKKTFQ